MCAGIFGKTFCRLCIEVRMLIGRKEKEIIQIIYVKDSLGLQAPGDENQLRGPAGLVTEY